MAIRSETNGNNLVLGTVTDKVGRPLSNLVVQAYDRALRSEQLLGEAVTGRDGKYEIAWSRGKGNARGKTSARSKDSVDLAITVVTREKKQLLFASGVDEIRFRATRR